MRARTGWLAVVACAAALAACSDGTEESASSEDPTSTEERAAAEELLRTAGYLDDDGTVTFGPAGPGEDETDVHEALCTYLFGAPEEVGERAGIDGAELAEGSGYQMLGANGSGVQCYWGPAGGPVLALVSWGSEADWITEAEADGELEALVQLPDGVGVAYYDPESDVGRLSAADLEEWLTEAPAVTQSV